MTFVDGPAALAGFRAGLTGRHGLDLLRQHGGQVLIQMPVGVGKSRFLDAITEEAVVGDHHDLVVVLTPTRRLIEERRPLRDPPPVIRVVNLRPRPAAHCGPGRDALWKKYEDADLGTLGRVEICGHCPLRRGCFWPEQYGRGLKGARVVYATQAHLVRSPGFLARLSSWVGARRVLTLLDETDFTGKSYEGVIPAAELARFVDALNEATFEFGGNVPRTHQRWLDLAGMLRHATTTDLQEGDWRMPAIDHGWAEVVQRIGLRQHGDAFKFLAYRLGVLGVSPIETRRKVEGGDLQFGTRPYVGDCMVFTGSTDPAFARYRLSQDLASPYADHRFFHPDTRWYNIASPIGSRRYFPRHVPQVLDFYAELTARRTRTGKRVLLVAKKCFVTDCAEGMRPRLASLGADLLVATCDWTEETLADPRVVPLISYGMIGTNLFEHFDCAYCLTGYYIDEWALNHCLQDLTRQDLRLPIRIETTGNPRRRRAGVANPAHRDYDIARLAQPALEFKEHGVVVQAVGRVRPFTRPREVITFQMAELPGVRYDAELSTLAEARRFLDVPTGRDRQGTDRAARVAALRREGRTQVEVAGILGISERTVRTYEHPEDRKKSIS